LCSTRIHRSWHPTIIQNRWLPSYLIGWLQARARRRHRTPHKQPRKRFRKRHREKRPLDRSDRRGMLGTSGILPQVHQGGISRCGDLVGWSLRRLLLRVRFRKRILRASSTPVLTGTQGVPSRRVLDRADPNTTVLILPIAFEPFDRSRRQIVGSHSPWRLSR
jgi:hypothetical protein